MHVENEGPFGWVKNDEACDGGVGLECHSGSISWAQNSARIVTRNGYQLENRHHDPLVCYKTVSELRSLENFLLPGCFKGLLLASNSPNTNVDSGRAHVLILQRAPHH